MAETVHLFLKVNGSDVKGESTQTSVGRADSIECVHYEHNINTVRDPHSGHATGRRVHEPIVIRKRIDKSSPLIAKALVENTKIDASFKFYRPNPTGDGTTEQFYTVSIKDGRVAGLKQLLPPRESPEAPLEEVTFTFHTINWTFTNGGVTHEDSWAANR